MATKGRGNALRGGIGSTAKGHGPGVGGEVAWLSRNGIAYMALPEPKERQSRPPPTIRHFSWEKPE